MLLASLSPLAPLCPPRMTFNTYTRSAKIANDTHWAGKKLHFEIVITQRGKAIGNN